MSEKRRDNKGRILKEGESQRSNGTYMYRFTSSNKKRQTIYAPTLAELREKEKKIQSDITRGINYDESMRTIAELLDILMYHNRTARKTTQRTYAWHVKELKQFEFIHQKVRDIRTSSAKSFIIHLEEKGYGYSTIKAMCSILKRACNIALEDDAIFRNPFSFTINSVLTIKPGERNALTKKQQAAILEYVGSSERFQKHLDVIQILMGTGLRIGELCGLTETNLDFKNRRIFVRYQMATGNHRDQALGPPKTDNGIRDIPMSDVVYMALKRTLIKNKEITERHEVSGHTDFVFLSDDGYPRRTLYFSKSFASLSKAYEKDTGERIYLSPHVLRHTFCSNLIDAGIDIKSMQYLMGHAKADVTLNTYTHMSYDHVENAFKKAVGSL